MRFYHLFGVWGCHLRIKNHWGCSQMVPGTRGSVVPSETRREYVPIDSSKTSLFLKVSEGTTDPLVL